MSLKVAELFAGVGGFRLGLESVGPKTKKVYETVWSNQWEPGTSKQYASDVYVKQFGRNGHCEEDIEKVLSGYPGIIRDHDVLVGGFPCQDYSVATTLKSSGGLEGKKGVLWWSIYGLLEYFIKERKVPTKYLILENVNRLLVSPAKQRGRDLAVILSCLDNLGYAVEWRIVNAADYGEPQRRRRIFLVGYHRSTNVYQDYMKLSIKDRAEDILRKNGILQNAFPSILDHEIIGVDIDHDIAKVSQRFNKGSKVSPFLNSGMMMDGKIFTTKVEPFFTGKKIVLGNIIDDDNGNIKKEYFITKKELMGEKGWAWHKGSKAIDKVNKAGHNYTFKEGSMVWPDPLDKPSRTIITSEGGRTPSRFKHLIEVDGRCRRILPRELDQLSGFPRDWTRYGFRNDRDKNGNYEYEVPDAKRAFLIGNALVVGCVTRIGKALWNKIY